MLNSTRHQGDIQGDMAEPISPQHVRRLRVRKAKVLGLLVAFCFALASHASANSITYDVNQTIGPATVKGTITTDGSLGTIFSTDITSFNLTLSDTSGDSFNYTSSVFSAGDDITATSTDLLFSYTGGPDVGYLLFQPTYGNSHTFFCLATSGNLPLCDPGEAIVPKFWESPTTGYNASISGEQVFATVPGTVPEPSTVGLMVVGLLGLLKVTRWRIARGLSHTA
jgi:hypothetical protein